MGACGKPALQVFQEAVDGALPSTASAASMPITNSRMMRGNFHHLTGHYLPTTMASSRVPVKTERSAMSSAVRVRVFCLLVSLADSVQAVDTVMFRPACFSQAALEWVQ